MTAIDLFSLLRIRNHIKYSLMLNYLFSEVKQKPKKELSSLAAAFAASDDESDGEEIFKVEKKVPESKQKVFTN